MRCTQLAPLLLGLSLFACGGADSLDDSARQDGFRFTRPLALQSAELEADYEAKLSPNSFAAFEFSVVSPTILYAQAEPGLWTQFWDALDVVDDYQTDIVLFRVDESAAADDLNDRYDLISQTDQHPLEAAFRPLEYRVYSPGRYMALVLGTEAAEADELEVNVELRGLLPLEQRSPGRVELKVLVAGDPAVGLRVAVGNVETRVDDSGMAVLEDVAAGIQTVRFGNDGLGRVYTCAEVNVIGQGETERMLCHILADDFELWMQ